LPKYGRSQVESALDRNTSRILRGEVIDEFGDEGKRILIQIARDQSQPAERRIEAIRLLGDKRSDEAYKALVELLHENNTVCGTIHALQAYRNPALVPAFLGLLEDRRSCGNIVRFTVGGNADERKTEVLVSDEAVEALEHITRIRLEKENDLFVIGHRATQPWKDWWNENRDAFGVDPSRFMAPEKSAEARDDHYPCSVETIAVSPDGKIAFSAGKSYDPWVRAWNIALRQQLWATPNVRDDDAESARFSKDGQTVAMGTSNGAVKLFDVASGHRLRMLIIGRSVDSLAFSPDGTTLALSSDDGLIRFFDTKSWCETKQINNSDMTEGIAFSPDGTLLAAATFERVRLWDVARAAKVRDFPIRPAKSPTFFIDEGERSARLWRMAWSVAFSPDGKLLATGSSAAVQLWNPITGHEVSTAPSNGEVRSLWFSPDGRWVIWGTSNDEIVKWNPPTGKRERIKNQFSMGDTALTPDGRLALSPGAGTQIAIYDLETRRKAGVLECTNKRGENRGHPE
jgi:WD domain, G-beta repeat